MPNYFDPYTTTGPFLAEANAIAAAFGSATNTITNADTFIASDHLAMATALAVAEATGPSIFGPPLTAALVTTDLEGHGDLYVGQTFAVSALVPSSYSYQAVAQFETIQDIQLGGGFYNYPLIG